ncbi:hypothetical protein SK128_004645 [Halocaridina rubra]|uniref:Uncharacterized protein n=1 Tax=Halocaridina rubra TaxID=373956 RepID=A0AAN9ABX7_HALRR
MGWILEEDERSVAKMISNQVANLTREREERRKKEVEEKEKQQLQEQQQLQQLQQQPLQTQQIPEAGINQQSQPQIQEQISNNSIKPLQRNLLHLRRSSKLLWMLLLQISKVC